MSVECLAGPVGVPTPSPLSEAETWEVLSQLSQLSAFTFVGDDDDDAKSTVSTMSTVSISTRHGFPALSTSDAVLIDDDNSTAAPVLSFKDALLGGAGGITTTKAKALQCTPRVVIQRKVRKTKPKTIDEKDGDDPLDWEYYGRKEKGFKRYARNRSVFAARLPSVQETSSFGGGTASDDDATDDDDDETMY